MVKKCLVSEVLGSFFHWNNVEVRVWQNLVHLLYNYLIDILVDIS